MQNIEPGDQLLVSKDGNLQLRKPLTESTYMVKAQCRGFSDGIWTITTFLSRLSGLKAETFRLPDMCTATAAVFLPPGQDKATEAQKIVAD